jgi:hypothetical protein
MIYINIYKNIYGIFLENENRERSITFGLVWLEKQLISSENCRNIESEKLLT